MGRVADARGTMTQPHPPSAPAAWAGTAIRIGLLVGAAVGLHLFIDATLARIAASDDHDMIMIGVLAALILAYAILIALPFVPGIEIGLTLLALRGAEIAPFLYLATLAGLMLAYGAGRALSYDWLSARLLDLRLTRAATLLEEARDMSPERRLAALRARLPRRLGDMTIRFRYLLIALLINLPGSGLIGGGGGICLLAGFSRTFAPLPTVLTLALAVAPVPFLVWYTGYDPAGLIPD